MRQCKVAELSRRANDAIEHRSHVRFLGSQPVTRNVRISSWATARLFC
jgi:hypothetical protein